ncbi:MAG: hypothetical protein IKM31_10785 [Oscillospiraceae bacterium]|nr:hypothetical protein [Oscillospiraceae bacterium]
MKPQLLRILENMRRYNSADMAAQVFGLDPDTVYDALIVAPGWRPEKILKDPSFRITLLRQASYTSGWLVEKDDLKLAWIQTASGACNLIDHLTICAELQFRKLIFIGAVGSLTKEIGLGELCTSSRSISGVFANAYFCDKLIDYRPFESVYPPDEDYLEHISAVAAEMDCPMRKAVTYCTDSISLEYSHLDEIKAMGAELIEMETSSFYLLAGLMEIPAAALMIVSDNSASDQPLIGRTKSQQEKFDYGRTVVIPELICRLAKEK